MIDEIDEDGVYDYLIAEENRQFLERYFSPDPNYVRPEDVWKRGDSEMFGPPFDVTTPPDPNYGKVDDPIEVELVIESFKLNPNTKV